jgi:hypothetical protein
MFAKKETVESWQVDKFTNDVPVATFLLTVPLSTFS